MHGNGHSRAIASMVILDAYRFVVCAYAIAKFVAACCCRIVKSQHQRVDSAAGSCWKPLAQVTAEIYRQHGDALFEKRAYDQARSTRSNTHHW